MADEKPSKFRQILHVIGSGAVAIAVWAYQHPDTVISIVNGIKEAREKK